MIHQYNTVHVEWVDLPKELRDDIKNQHDWRFHNDICIKVNGELPTYEELCDYDNALIREAAKWECTPSEVEGDSDWALCKRLFDLNPDAFKGFNALIIDICW